MRQRVICEDDDMAKVEDEPLGKLLTILHKLKRGLVVLEWELEYLASIVMSHCTSI